MLRNIELKNKISDREGKKEALRWLGICFVGISAAILMNYLLLQAGVTNASDKFKTTAQAQFATDFWTGILKYGVVIPVVEEILFRYILQGFLWKWSKNITIAILLSAVAFGLYHGNIVQGIHGFIIGLLLGFFFYYMQTIWASVLVHGLANIVIFLCGVSVNWYGIVFQVWLMPVYGLIVIGGIFLFYKDTRPKCMDKKGR